MRVAPGVKQRGAAISVVSRARSGSREKSAAAGSSERGWWREAPFGEPVVPEVRITTRPRSRGGESAFTGPAAISCSSVGCAGCGESCHAITLVRPAAAAAHSSLNSSS